MARPFRRDLAALAATLLLSVAGCTSLLGEFSTGGADAGADASGDGPLGDDSGNVDAVSPPTDGSGKDAASESTGTSADFSLTIAVPIVGVVRGASGSVAVTVTPANGFSAAVAVTVSGLPSGITADPLTLAAGATTGNLTLHAPSGATLGDGPTLTVTGTAGALSHGASLALLVQDASGTLDTTFGNQGIVQDDVTFNAFGGFAMQADGKIVVCGAFDGPPLVAFVRRFNADGSVDMAFGSPPDGGTAWVTLALPPGGVSAGCGAVTVLPSGNIALAGIYQTAQQFPQEWVAELNSAGSLDASFGQAGIATLSAFSAGAVSRVVADPAGNLVVAGATSSTTQTHPMFSRFTAAGTVDTTFGSSGGGYTLNMYPGATAFTDLAIEGVQLFASVAASNVAVQRYTTAGLLDSTFYNQGTATVVVGAGTSSASALAVASDGTVVVAGAAAITSDSGATSAIAVARLQPGGHADPAFGTGGGALLPLGSGDSAAYGVAIDPWGRPVLAGQIESTGSTAAFGVARLSTTGQLDSVFAGGQGYVSTPAGYESQALRIASLADGRLLAVGQSGGRACYFSPDAGAICDTHALILARYWP